MKVLVIGGCLAAFALQALAGVTVSKPVQNAQVTSPFGVTADASVCHNESVTAMGYSLDSNKDIANLKKAALAVDVTAEVGKHTVHVKAWNGSGNVCVTDVAIEVIAPPPPPPPPPSGPVIPSNAISVSDIQVLDKWHWNHDPGTSGTATGTSSLVSTPSLSGNARKFVSTYTDAGGEIYSVSYADDTASTNFVWDGWVYFQAGSQVGNLETDSNQVVANGDTVIYAFQCAGDSNTWDYSGAGAHWVHSNQSCNPAKWSSDTWHHEQISYSRDSSGNVTYHGVWLDGVEAPINETVPSSFALKWAMGDINTQFQIDGIGKSGGSTVYLDKLTIYRW